MAGCHKRTQENPFYRARMEAAAYNDALKSREGAAEALGVHPSTIANYELGTRCSPQPDLVLMMADLYRAPELLNFFCSNECPIGLETVAELSLNGIDRIAIQTLSSLKDVESVKDSLIEIVADGVVSADEEEALEQILEHLEAIAKAAKELRLWIEKNV